MTTLTEALINAGLPSAQASVIAEALSGGSTSTQKFIEALILSGVDAEAAQLLATNIGGGGGLPSGAVSSLGLDAQNRLVGPTGVLLDVEAANRAVSEDGLKWISLPKTGDASATLNNLIAEFAAEKRELRIGPGDFNFDGPIYWRSGMRLHLHPNARFIRQFTPGGGIAAFVDQLDRSTEVTDVEWTGGQIVQGATAYGGNVIGGRLRRASIRRLTIDGYGSPTQSGRAVSAIMHDSFISRLRAINPEQRVGVGGIRLLGGTNTLVSKCYVVSGDDCFQFVPAVSGQYGNESTSHCWYVDCHGISTHAKLATVANTDRNETILSPLSNSIRDSGFVRVHGTHYGVGVQVDVSGDTSGDIRNIVVQDMQADMSASQTGAMSSILVTVDDGTSGGFNGGGIDGLHIIRGRFTGSRKQTLSIIDQTTVAGDKLRNITCTARLGKPRDTDKTVDVQACVNLKLSGEIEGHPESTGVVKLGGIGKRVTAQMDASVSGIGGGAGHIATGFGLQVFSGVESAVVSSVFTPTTEYVTNDSRAVQVNAGVSGVFIQASDGSKLTAAKRLRVTSNGAAFESYTVKDSAGLLSTEKSPARLPSKTFDWVVPLPPFVAANTTAVPAVDVAYLVPVFVNEDISIDTIGFRVVTAAAAGGVARVGIWRNEAGQPSTCVAVSDVIATTTAGAVTGAISTSMTPGWYWIGVVCSGALPATKAIASSSPALGVTVGAPSIGVAIPGGLNAEFAGISAALAYSSLSSLPSLAAVSVTRLSAAAVPIVSWRIA